ncbi:MAG: lysophospholipid acyltransferase family protein, partial [Acidimicrobiales bacterium]
MAEPASPPPPPSNRIAPQPPGRAALAWWWVARSVVELVSRALWRIEIRGREHLPASGAFVIAPVHRSNIDTLIASCLLHRRVRFMGKDTLWKYGWSRALLTSLG